MIHPRVTRTQSTHYHPLSPETRATAPAPIPGYWLLIVTPRPPPLLFVKMDCFLVNECCVHYVELNPMSNISKSCETHEKLWKFCERLDLLVKKMVRGRFADIWEDLMGFLENRFTWCFGCRQTRALGAAQGKWNRKIYICSITFVVFTVLVTCLPIIITLKHWQPRM